MPQNIHDLRTHLFETIKALRANDNPMDIDRARAVSDVVQTVINTVKVEIEMLKVIGTEAMKPSGFIPLITDRTALEHEHTESGTALAPAAPRAHL